MEKNQTQSTRQIDEIEFAKLEYQTLRREIEHSKQRMFVVCTGGVSVVTAADYFAVAPQSEIGLFALLLPFLVLAVAIVFLSQNEAKFRAGLYIRKHLEPGSEGWENWLEYDESTTRGSEADDNARRRRRHREVDRHIKIGFLIIFLAYYAFAVYAAVESLYRYGAGVQNGALWLFVILGVGATGYFTVAVKTST